MKNGQMRPRLTAEEDEVLRIVRTHGAGAVLSALPSDAPDVLLDVDDGIDTYLPPLQVDGSRVLVLGDIHAPYHDLAALNAALTYGRRNRADTIILNGDFLDCHKISKYTKNPTSPSLAHEFSTGAAILKGIRAAFPAAKIVYKLGNHEERLGNHLKDSAPEVYGLFGGIEEIYRTKLGLDDLGIVLVPNQQLIRLGDLYVAHGNEINISGVHAAYMMAMRMGANVLASHLHRSQERAIKGRVKGLTAGWVTGCLCNLRPGYYMYNDWVHGFAFVDVRPDGTFAVSLKVIHNGQVL